MKTLKSVLLGSAAGVVAVAGAQAADLPVKAKPVEYVKICTLYGDGFYYIPGSDTCIRFSGYIRADYNWNGRRPHVLAPFGAQDRTIQRSTMSAPRQVPSRHPHADRLWHAPHVHERQLRQRHRLGRGQRLPCIRPMGRLHVRPHRLVHRPGRRPRRRRHAVAALGPPQLLDQLQRHQPDRLHVAARQRHHLQHRRRRRPRQVDRQPDGDGHDHRQRSDQLRSRPVASRSVGGVAGQSSLGQCQPGLRWPQECGPVLHCRRRCRRLRPAQHHVVQLSGRQVGLGGPRPASRSSSTC